MNKVTLLIISALLGISHAFGGGNVSFNEQLLPILKQDSTFAAEILNILDFSDHAFAQSDFGDHTRFSGKRLGPYTVLAKPKGSPAPWVFEVTINTRWTIYDQDGHVIPLKNDDGKMTGIFDPKAVRLEEKFECIEIRPRKEK